MAKVVAMAHAPQVTGMPVFSPLMPVALPLPFPGDWGKITAVYDVAAALSIGGRWAEVTADLQEQAAPLDAQYNAVMAALEDQAEATAAQVQAARTAKEKRDAWAAQAEHDAPLYKEQAAILQQQREIRRATNIRVLDLIVVRFEWPFAGPAPDPHDPATFETWPDPILNWMTQDALGEVAKRLHDPLSWTGSTAT
jgi:hypothetical protein